MEKCSNWRIRLNYSRKQDHHYRSSYVFLPSKGDAKKLHQQFRTCSTATPSAAWGEALSLGIHGIINSLTSSSPAQTDFQSLLSNICTANSFRRRKHSRRQCVSSCSFMAWPELFGLNSLELRLQACTKYGNASRLLEKKVQARILVEWFFDYPVFQEPLTWISGYQMWKLLNPQGSSPYS